MESYTTAFFLIFLAGGPCGAGGSLAALCILGVSCSWLPEPAALHSLAAAVSTAVVGAVSGLPFPGQALCFVCCLGLSALPPGVT